MKTLIVLIVLMFAGCNHDGQSTPITNNSYHASFDLQCIDGVTYILYGIGHGSLSVKLDKDSKIVPCKP